MPNPSTSNYVPALRFAWLTPYYDVVVGTTTRERAFKQARHLDQTKTSIGNRHGR